VSRQSVVGVLTCAGAGLYGAVALGSINSAAHMDEWGLRAFYACSGLYAAVCAAGLVAPRKAVRAESGPLLSSILVAGFLLPLAARPEGGVPVWEGGAWIGALGAAGALASSLALGRSFALAPAVRETVSRGPYALIRHPIAASFLVSAVGFLLVRFSLWNLAVCLAAAGMAVVASLCEERLLRDDPAYVDYARRVPRRFIPGML